MKLLLTTVVLVAALPALADGPGLKGLLESARKENLDQRTVREARLKASADYRSAWSSLLPSVTGQATWTNNEYEAKLGFPNPYFGPYNIMRTAGPGPVAFGDSVMLVPTGDITVTTATLLPKNQFDGAIRVDLPIIDVPRWMRASAAGASEAAAEQRELFTADAVSRQVVNGYYGYAAALAVRESARRSLGVAETQLKLMEIRLKAGSVTELEQLRARAELERSKQIVADTDNLVATTRRLVKTLSGADPGDAVPMPNDDVRPETSFELLEQSVDQLPAVRAADRDADAAGRAGWSSRLLLVPSVAANFTERFTNAPGLVGKDHLYALGVTATWRLDVPTVMGFESARAAESMAALAAEKARVSARDQVHSDWQRLRAALVKVEAAAAQQAAAARASLMAHDRFAVGASTQVDVIQADRDLFGAEVGQIQARTELAIARASLHLSAGLPLDVD